MRKWARNVAFCEACDTGEGEEGAAQTPRREIGGAGGEKLENKRKKETKHNFPRKDTSPALMCDSNYTLVYIGSHCPLARIILVRSMLLYSFVQVLSLMYKAPISSSYGIRHDIIRSCHNLKILNFIALRNASVLFRHCPCRMVLVSRRSVVVPCCLSLSPVCQELPAAAPDHGLVDVVIHILGREEERKKMKGGKSQKG